MIYHIRQQLQIAWSHQKSYVDRCRSELEFQMLHLLFSILLFIGKFSKRVYEHGGGDGARGNVGGSGGGGGVRNGVASVVVITDHGGGDDNYGNGSDGDNGSGGASDGVDCGGGGDGDENKKS
ncbi:glycine-rich cell wall structural protein 1-like [Lactuca sativa]|uniref:glycine-rich cell wall structural protein 1-like n=1 Tax=Lactuca sativa TaxID=4236 RepID=UPI000CD860E6|nr:glycine-rich cell wall structural protein 1-like [Lactuca sativa]